MWLLQGTHSQPVSQALTNSYLAQQEGTATNKSATVERSVSMPQQQDLSSCSRICGAVGGLKQGSTSTTLVTKASWIIVQRRYFAGPRLNHVRDVSLGTKVVTEKEQLAQHEEKQQIHRFSPFFLLLLLSFFFFSFFSFFLQGPKSFVWYYDTPQKKGYCTQPLRIQI